jgi:hypothetical protein
LDLGGYLSYLEKVKEMRRLKLTKIDNTYLREIKKNNYNSEIEFLSATLLKNWQSVYFTGDITPSVKTHLETLSKLVESSYLIQSMICSMICSQKYTFVVVKEL